MNHTTPAQASDRPQRHAVFTVGVIGCAVALTIALAACQTGDASGEPSSSPTKQSVASSAASGPARTKTAPTPAAQAEGRSTASKTPTPAPARVDELKEAQAAYVKYVKAYIEAGKISPPPGKPPKSLLAMTTGPERQWLKNAFVDSKKQQAVILTGTVKITMSDEIDYDGTDVDTIQFNACWDERSIVADRGGKREKSDPWLLNRVKMRHVVNDHGRRHWLAYSQTDQDQDPKESCVIN